MFLKVCSNMVPFLVVVGSGVASGSTLPCQPGWGCAPAPQGPHRSAAVVLGAPLDDAQVWPPSLGKRAGAGR